MIIFKFWSKNTFWVLFLCFVFSVRMSPNPALKHHFQLSLNGAWVWWIRVIVLYITLGGLLEDNPLLGETRPNTTSLISLLRPCCFVATKSHAQLSDTARSPYWWRIPPIFRGHLRCPLTDFVKSSSFSTLSSDSVTIPVWAASVSLCPPEVQCFTVTRRQSWSWWAVLIASEQVHTMWEQQRMQMDLNAQAAIVRFASILKSQQY